MLTFLYSIYDKIAQEAGPVFEAKNDLVAARGFRLGIPKNTNPAEFTLFCIGSMSHDPIKLIGFETPREVVVNDAESLSGEA